ncbi:ARM repeat-containing protein [Coprinellus micaceus]|uniref:MMS19 nucleotide excision repair protein n=1 Tax=Coprinellus micaceus TaxID=71717 RepID=A0A4Y7TS84_COPMI|nr:ARM repeat-containing protein [Coprinellus micaceus]
MEATERLARTWIASGREEELVQIASDISSSKTTLLNLVKALGEYLKRAERSPGVELLSLVLAKLAPDSLNRPAVRTLANFYTDKLDDADTIIPALQGLVTLASFPTFGPAEATTVIEGLLRHVKMKALTQNHRFKVFSIIDSVMANQREVIKGMGKKFLDGYVSLCEGEKDPRNLVLVFAMDRVILIEFDISERVQSLYDVIFCYFPITFRPPPNNPGGITADDLRLTLRSVVSATPLFGPLAIPHYLDNLAAVGRPAKRDILETLNVCLPVYGPKIARSFARKLWNSLKLEVFQPVDVNTEQLALKTLQTLINTIYASEEGNESQTDVQGLARDACEECLTILREPEKSQARPATRVLCSFMATTPSVAKFTVSQAIPHLTKLFINPDEVTARPATLVLLAQFIEAARDAQDKDTTTELFLAPYKDEVLGALSSGLKAHNLRLPSLGGLKGLVTTQRLLTDQELGFIVHHIDEIIQDHPDRFDDISDGVLELLGSIAEVAPQIVVEQTLPILFSGLPDVAPAREAAAGRAQAWKALSYLQTLCTEPQLFDTLVVRLTTKLEHLTLANTLQVKVSKKHADVAKYLERLVVRLFKIFVYSALEFKETAATFLEDPRLLQAAAQCMTLVVRSLPQLRQEPYIKSLLLALSNGNIQPIIRRSLQNTEGCAAKHLRVFLLPFPKRLDVTVLRGCDATLQGATFREMQQFTFVAVIVNRKVDELEGFLEGFSTKFWSNEVLNAELSLERRHWAIVTWTWVYQVFSDASINWDAAKSVGLIPGHDDILTKDNHAVTRILYAQKYVKVMLPQTISGSQDTSGGWINLVAFLVALAGLIKSAPKATYLGELPSLMPLLIRGLDLPDPQIRSNVIETLLAAADGETPEKSLVAEHASTLVNAMLKNCMAKEMPSSTVRVAALQYLAVLPSIVRYDVLHPYKTQVIKELGKALDDPKKTVRKEAVEARTIWFKYNG